MNISKSTFLTSITMIILVLVSIGLSNAQTTYNNNNALKNVTQSNIYFDVSLDDDQKLLLRLNLLQRTIQQMKDAGVDVSVVIGFRGGASRFITRDDHYVLEEETDNKHKIQEQVSRLANEGILIEQCSIAAELFDIAYDDFLPEIDIVGNGYISLIGYQNQGYAVVPMD
jgi:intracellular sulfur oxidation DsrE/DsrF family protein